MGLPPVTSLFPSLGGLKTSNASKANDVEASSPKTEDLVEISNEALEKLESANQLSRRDASIENVFRETQRILQEDESLTLGLAPDFS